MQNEPTRHGTEAFRIDTVNHVQPVDGIKLHQYGGDRLNVIQLLQLIADRNRHWSAAEGHEHRRRWRLHHDVRADALGSLGRIYKQAAGEAHNKNHKSDFDSHGDHRDKRANGTMQHIVHDHVADHGCTSFVSSPTGTSSVPRGCCNWKRSAAIASFTVSFSIPI